MCRSRNVINEKEFHEAKQNRLARTTGLGTPVTSWTTYDLTSIIRLHKGWEPCRCTHRIKNKQRRYIVYREHLSLPIMDIRLKALNIIAFNFASARIILHQRR